MLIQREIWADGCKTPNFHAPDHRILWLIQTGYGMQVGKMMSYAIFHFLLHYVITIRQHHSQTDRKTDDMFEI